MEQDGMTSLDAAWRNERKWFKRTIISCIITFFALVGFIGAQYWIFSNMTATIASLGEEDIVKLQQVLSRAHLVSMATIVFLIVNCIAFLVSMVRWLLAIRTRRLCLVEGCDLISR